MKRTIGILWPFNFINISPIKFIFDPLLELKQHSFEWNSRTHRDFKIIGFCLEFSYPKTMENAWWKPNCNIWFTSNWFYYCIFGIISKFLNDSNFLRTAINEISLIKETKTIETQYERNLPSVISWLENKQWRIYEIQ